MNQRQKSLWSLTYILILLAAIIILFYWYASENNKRIELQNRTYAADSALQTANRIDDEFRNAMNRINTYAYFVGESLSEPVVTSQRLNDMEEKSLFDAFWFVDAETGSLMADGQTADVVGP